MLLNANKAINSLGKHIQSMMKVSAKYGKSMGTMGTMPFNSSGGATFARKTAKMMSERPEAAGAMMGRIMSKAEKAGMSEQHMGRMNEIYGRVMGEAKNMPVGLPKHLRLR